ncbi:MAG: hypothetical protein IJQ80_01740, partial [Clostridia bacterium]|nr:hypothetical protein [Clostridia bacterium]
MKLGKRREIGYLIDEKLEIVEMLQICERREIRYRVVREDDTLLDLTGASIDGDLAKHLHEVPNITEVDLRGIPLTIDEQKAL